MTNAVTISAVGLMAAAYEVLKDQHVLITSWDGSTRKVPLWRLQGAKGTMILTLKDGSKIEGTTEEIAALLTKGLEPVDVAASGKFYRSETRGTWVPISTMNIGHIRNALLKTYRDWASALSSKRGEELVKALSAGPNSPEFSGLFKAYVSRYQREES